MSNKLFFCNISNNTIYTFKMSYLKKIPINFFEKNPNVNKISTPEFIKRMSKQGKVQNKLIVLDPVSKNLIKIPLDKKSAEQDKKKYKKVIDHIKLLQEKVNKKKEKLKQKKLEKKNPKKSKQNVSKKSSIKSKKTKTKQNVSKKISIKSKKTNGKQKLSQSAKSIKLVAQVVKKV